MCGCASDHPGIECHGEGCHCHDEVYLSISVMRVPVSRQNAILRAVMAAADTNEISISFSTPSEG